MAKTKLAIVGLGYVGLPLAVAFAKKYAVVGFDIKKERINELKNGYDVNSEVETNSLQIAMKTNNDDAIGLLLTSNEQALQNANIFIVTVPTPVDKHHHPDLTLLKRATETVSHFITKESIVIYESTVYPGVTEDVCVPILEQGSELIFNKDFFVGYSPERINPGDKTHTLTNIKKVISGSTTEATETINQLYQSIITAGTYVAPSIKVAEAAKVIENAQRDINIAFMNELAKIFRYLNIDTTEVLEAAATKWNFLPFKPGLVGGHCIGVDPYYLAQRAMDVGFQPEIILAGRKLNDGMGTYIADEVMKLMQNKTLIFKESKALILGFAFKENCADVRNTKVIDIIKELQHNGIEVDVFDPWVKEEQVKEEYNIFVLNELPRQQYDVVIVAVAHRQFTQNLITNLCKNKSVLFDVKSVLDKSLVDGRL